MSLFQVEIEQTLRRRFFIECENEDEARGAVEEGLGDLLEPYDFDEPEIEVYRLPPDATVSGPLWRGGALGRWEASA